MVNSNQPETQQKNCGIFNAIFNINLLLENIEIHHPRKNEDDD